MYLKDINLKCFEKNDSSVSTPWIYAVLLRFQSRLKDHINIIPMKSIIQFLIHFFFFMFLRLFMNNKNQKMICNISLNNNKHIFSSPFIYICFIQCLISFWIWRIFKQTENARPFGLYYTGLSMNILSVGYKSPLQRGFSKK